MSENLEKVISALLATVAFIGMLTLAVLIMVLSFGPVVLVVALEGPIWVGVVAAIWGLFCLTFSFALLHEFDK